MKMTFRRFARGFLLTVNSCFLLLSLAASIVGSIIYVIGDQYHLTPTLAVGLINLGLISTLISVQGLVAAFKRSKLGLQIYLSLILLLMGSQVSCIVLAFLFKDYATDILRRLWLDDFSDQTRNLLQYNFNCCGFFNATDVAGSSCPGKDLPGCSDAIVDLFNEYSTYIYIAIFTLLALQILIVIVIISLNTFFYISNKIDLEFQTLHRNVNTTLPPQITIKDSIREEDKHDLEYRTGDT